MNAVLPSPHAATAHLWVATGAARRHPPLGLLIPAAGATEEPASAPRLSWETGAGKSYVIPALEVGGFIFGLNQFNQHFIDPKEGYDSDEHTFWRNLRTAPVYDKDPFSVNQIGHPYQGGI